MRRFAIALLFSLLAACAPVSTVTYDATADYGEKPLFEEAQVMAKAFMRDRLKDPDSAKWECKLLQHGALGDGKAFGSALAGWILPCQINGKNSYGAYAGQTPYAFLFKNGAICRVVEFGQEGLFATERVIYSRTPPSAVAQ